MLNMNRVTLLGHAGRDPEIRNLQNGGKAASFTLATTEKWKGKDGKPAESTEWHRIAVYGPTVEAVEKMLKQGRRGPGRGEDRVARIPRQGWQRPCGDRDRGGRVAGHGQHPVRAACEPGSRSGPGSRIAGCRGRRRCAGIPGMSRCFAPLAAFVLAAVLWSGAASGQSCTGRFVNPISDVCWECLFPISIGPIRMGSASGAPDTPNPGSPICFCGSPIPRIGLSLGVWEPARLMDVSRKPWCFPNLGGLTIDPGLPAARGKTGSSGGDGATGSVWHAHYYVYPLLSWIGALLDLGCLEGGSLDIAWTSELDPAWLDDELSFLLSPEAALFANLPAQAACAADCAAASAGLPLDPMFWCAGCQGGMYPLTGNVAAHVGGVQASLLAAQRLVYRLHRAGVAWGTSGSAALCGKYPMPVMKKSQYRWQMTQPVPATTPRTGCNPTGRSSVLWETLRELPVSGENFGYLLWRKRNCCLL